VGPRQGLQARVELADGLLERVDGLPQLAGSEEPDQGKDRSDEDQEADDQSDQGKEAFHRRRRRDTRALAVRTGWLSNRAEH
jgi:hypothetical protein